MPLTQTFTFLFGDTGIVLNADFPGSGATTNFVDVQKVSGLDFPDLRLTERDREEMDGGFVDALYMKTRTIVIEGVIYGNETYLDSLKTNYSPTATSLPLYFLSDGSTTERLVYCKCIAFKYDWEQLRRLGMTPFQIQLKASDPSIYSSSTVSGSIALGGTSTGAGFDMAFNMGFGGTTSVDSAGVLINTGNMSADATFTIPGPITDPAILHDNTGNRLQFTTTIASGDYFTVNLRNRTVLLNGNTNRRGTLDPSSRWFMILPGNNTIRFAGTTGGSPTLGYVMRSAYR